MAIFAISDLHLSFDRPVNPRNWNSASQHKPMDIFGKDWEEHYRKIYENWNKTVTEQDTVLVPGDISWAMRLTEAVHDFEFLGFLPGNIIGVQGNHDYWWQSISKVRARLPVNTRLLQNDHIIIDNIAICGTRGWICPNDSFFGESDEKIFRRELMRLDNSLKSITSSVKDIMVMMHYMPTNDKHDKSAFIELLQQYGVSTVVYGHLHAKASKYRLPEQKWGLNFQLVSADYLNFTPLLIK
jgi:predicted phosphohydrolase